MKVGFIEAIAYLMVSCNRSKVLSPLVGSLFKRRRISYPALNGRPKKHLTNL